jgi:dolichol-phosphate mannosyltransferase
MTRPDRAGPSTLVVLPTYNEADNLEIVVSAVLRQGDGFDVLVVDDGSPDGTGAIADRLADSDPRVEVLHRSGKLGLGPAYVAGLLRGLERGDDLLLTMDADLSHDPADLPRLVAAVAAGADVAVGSRWAPGGGTAGWPLHRRLLSRGGSAYARTLLGLPIQDVTGGFKCLRREAVRAIDVGSMRTTGYAFNIEVNQRAVRRGLRVVEVPIVFTERVRGRGKMGAAIVLEALAAVPVMRLVHGRPGPEATVPVLRAAAEATVELTGSAQRSPVAGTPVTPSSTR